MSTTFEIPEATEAKPEQLPVVYPVTDAIIANLKERFGGLTIMDNKGYMLVSEGISQCRMARTTVEKTRVQLKADALEFGRKVDGEAKRITSLIEEIEKPLKEAKAKVDEEKERAKREKEEAERKAIEDKIKADREAEEARLRESREAEEARLKAQREEIERERKALEEERAEAARLKKIEQDRIDAEQRIERERLAAIAEQQRIERERIEAAQRAQQEKLDAERRALEAEKAKADREEAARLAAIEAEKKAKLDAEREAQEAELRRLEVERKEAEERKRIEALKPDVEKINSFAFVVDCLRDKLPAVKSKAAKDFVEELNLDIQSLVEKCKEYRAK